MYRINLGLMISTDDLRFFVTLAASRSLAAAVALLNVTRPQYTHFGFRRTARIQSTARQIV